MRGGAVGRILLFVLAGVAAGLLTWIVSDGSGVIRLPSTTGPLTSADLRSYQIIFMTWGGSVGVLLGMADILAGGQTGQWPRVLGFGLLVGVPAGLLGGGLGMAFYGPLQVEHAVTAFDFLRNVFARAIGWGFIGALAGTAPGWRKLNFRVGRNGFWGGLFGGLLGGAAFEIVPYLGPGVALGSVSRLIGLLITGACIGLFVALVQELFKEAWIRVLVGRNEGKEILIEKARSTIGRAELSDIALYGDPSIARTHAVLAVQPDGRFHILDVSQSPVGVRVNDHPIGAEQVLYTGDHIQIGSKTLVFHERMARTPTAPSARDVARPQPIPLPPLPAAPLGVAVRVRRPPGREITAEAYLVATSGPYTGTVFPVRTGAVAGRDATAEIALPADTKASRAHARFLIEAGVCIVEDCASTNGTYVNGQRITRQALAPGDAVVVGATTFQFE